jgi:hypothetical protein
MFRSTATSPKDTEQKENQQLSRYNDARLAEIRELFKNSKINITKSGAGRMTEVEFPGDANAAWTFRKLVKALDKTPNTKFVAYLGIDKGKHAPTILLADAHVKFLNEKLPDIFTLEDNTAKNSKKATSSVGAKRWA